MCLCLKLEEGAGREAERKEGRQAEEGGGRSRQGGRERERVVVRGDCWDRSLWSTPNADVASASGHLERGRGEGEEGERMERGREEEGERHGPLGWVADLLTGLSNGLQTCHRVTLEWVVDRSQAHIRMGCRQVTCIRMILMICHHHINYLSLKFPKIMNDLTDLFLMMLMFEIGLCKPLQV